MISQSIAKGGECMTGGDKIPSPIHFINLGMSKEHVTKAIDQLSIRRIVVFTSPQLRSEAESYCTELAEKDVEVLEIIDVDPFQPDSLGNMMQSMLRTYDKYNPDGRTEIVSGLTGGTNLMAISLGIVSMLKRMHCHYVVSPPDDRVIEIDIFERLAGCNTLEEMEQGLKGGLR